MLVRTTEQRTDDAPSLSASRQILMPRLNAAFVVFVPFPKCVLVCACSQECAHVCLFTNLCLCAWSQACANVCLFTNVCSRVCLSSNACSCAPIPKRVLKCACPKMGADLCLCVPASIHVCRVGGGCCMDGHSSLGLCAPISHSPHAYTFHHSKACCFG